jgi:hypothetical protein
LIIAGSISAAALERTMRLQDVLLKAMAKKISWMEAAEIAGVTDRTIRRIRDRYEEFGSRVASIKDEARGAFTGSRSKRPRRYCGCCV